MTILKWQKHVGFATETAGWGQAVKPNAVYYVPEAKCEMEDKPKFYYDEAYRSIQAKDFGAYNTVFTGDLALTIDAYMDTLPPLLGNAMVGATDSVSIVFYSTLGVGLTTGTVNAHTYLLGTPESLTVYDYNGYSERRYEGTRFSQVDLKYNPDMQVTVDFKGESRLSVLNATSGNVVAPTIGSRQPVLAWQAQASFAGTNTTRLIDANVTFKRATEVLFTQAMTQSPTNIYAFPLEVSGKITVDFQDETEYNFFRTNNQSQTFKLFFFQNPGGNTTSAAQEGFSLLIPQPVYDTYKVNTGKDALTADISFRAVYNAPNSSNVVLVFYNATQTSAWA